MYASRPSLPLSSARERNRCARQPTSSKYSHHSAADVANATISAVPIARSISAADAVAPVTTIDSPSAMMTNSWNRSAKCAVSISQSVVADRPSRGVQ